MVGFLEGTLVLAPLMSVKFRRQPARTRNHSLLGQVLGMQGRFVEAQECFAEALRLSPGDTEATGGLELARRKAAEAASVLEQAALDGAPPTGDAYAGP